MRPMDFSRRSNQLVVALTVLALIVAGVLWLNDGELDLLWAPVYLFVIWGLVREIDPDHDYTALVAGVAAAVWVLVGADVMSWVPMVGMVLAARLVTNTTGRRPLPIDLGVMAAVATGISFTDVGWVAGFGLAVGVYVDDRMSDQPTRAGVITAAVAAVGASVLATLTNAFPRELPEVRPGVVVVVGLLALVAVVREPELPLSVSDSRLNLPVERERLHASRVLIAILTFGMTIFLGTNGLDIGPVAIALALVLVSNEVESVVRGRVTS